LVSQRKFKGAGHSKTKNYQALLIIPYIVRLDIYCVRGFTFCSSYLYLFTGVQHHFHIWWHGCRFTENQRPVASRRQTWSHMLFRIHLAMSWIRTQNF